MSRSLRITRISLGNDPGDKKGYNPEKQKRYEEGYFNKYVARFHKEGCELFGCNHNVREEETSHDGIPSSVAQSALYEILGDDVDGIEAMMADEGF
jgi:hypothetical protein